MREEKLTEAQIRKGLTIIGVFILLRASTWQLLGGSLHPASLEYALFLLGWFLVGSIGLVYFGFTKWVGIDLKQWWLNRKITFGDIGWGVLGAIVVAILATVIGLPLLMLGFISGQPAAEESFSLFGILLGLFFGFAIASFQEETIFRGFLQDLFTERFEKWKGNLLQAALFSIAHVGYYPLAAWYLFIAAFLSGIFYGWLKMKRGTLIAPAIAHGLMG